jgi:hypothetical protein
LGKCSANHERPGDRHHSSQITKIDSARKVKPDNSLVRRIARLIPGASGNPVALAIDPSGSLYVAVQNLGYGGATTGNEIDVWEGDWHGGEGVGAPSRVITGPNTGLEFPSGMAFDTSGNLYVLNGLSITVYPPGANGNVSPIRTIRSHPADNFLYNQGIALDVYGNLYVSQGEPARILVFAPGAYGDVVPIRIIQGDQTQFASGGVISAGAIGP